MFEYAVTVKKTRKPVNIDEYTRYLNHLTGIYTLGNVNVETTKGLHIHFLLTSNKKIDYKNMYIDKYGWSIRAVLIYNRQGWVNYCAKDFIKNYALTSDLLKKVKKKEPTEADIEQIIQNDPNFGEWYSYDEDQPDTELDTDDVELFGRNIFI